ncbi:MarR family winged helix-turn-helix transcriptional regulator [Cytobacillus sp. IB215316]|uniref:MarR family winged helix-turn-helix transcriptional regulator n=2 Tax=Bacillales TaxID=1385 RepID=UPI0039B77FF9
MYNEFKILDIERFDIMEENKEINSALKLFVVMSKAQRSIVDVVSKDVKSYGLNTTEFGVLDLLYNKEKFPLQKIGEHILIASGSITYVVDKLEQKGLIERKGCPKDRRVTYAAITKAGVELMDDIFPKHKKVIDEIFSVLTEDEKQMMIGLWKKVGFHVSQS